MEQSVDRSNLERLADETAAQAFGVGFNNLHSFVTQKPGSREGGDMMKTMDALLCRLFQHRNRLLRLSLLPDEILLHIFKLAIDFNWNKDIIKSKSIYDDLKTYYQSLYPIERVCKRWRDIIVSYAPFWSLISGTMSGDMIELALARARDSTLSVHVGVQYMEPVELRQFIDRVLRLSNRVESLTMDDKLQRSNAAPPLWMMLPKIQNLRITNADDVDYKEPDESSRAMNIPSPRRICLLNCALPTVPTLYSQVEELALEHPSETLPWGPLKLILERTPRLRVLRLEGVRYLDARSQNDPSSLAPIPMHHLQLLHISQADQKFVTWILSRFQLSPRTSLRLACWDWNATQYRSQIRDRIWAALDSAMEPSFALDLSLWAYKFQTRSVSIEIEKLNRDQVARWPDFFDGFVPRAGQGPIRVYIFLTCESNIDTDVPDEGCIKGLHNDSFVIMG
ncbi:hypothetical protein FRC01_012857 [Tulasnella sp. 417]|nr:hypothetical protein FRC01_012857 [Tulasnella sp. 417]